jgi:hypothetical protein
MTILGVDGIESYAIVGLLFAIISVAGCYQFARTVNVGRTLSLALAVVFLAQTFFGLHIYGYGATGFGFALLPAFCVTFLYVCKSSGLTSLVSSIVIMTLVMIFFAFLDGYAFIMAVACGVAILASQTICDSRIWRNHLRNFGVLAFATGTAFSLYKAYMPAVGLPGYPLNVFAYMSVHIPSLFRPTTGYSVLYDFLGLSKSRPASDFVGAGLGNHESIFVSITALIVCAVSFFIKIPNVCRLTALLLIVGGGIMAVGPVLPESNGQYDGTTLITRERAPIVAMPTYPLYTSLPGLDQMRATYRWIAVVKLGFWMLLCLVCSYLVSRYRYGQVIACVLVTLMMLETSANPAKEWSFGESQYRTAKSLQQELVGDIKAHVPAKSKLLVLPIANDFVIHFVAAKADVYTYNVGGDKNLLIAESQRPSAITNIATGGSCFLNAVSFAVTKGELDFVAFRIFDSLRNLRGWAWPPSKAEMDENERVATVLSKAVPESLLIKGKYFWFLNAHDIERTALNASCPTG